MGSIKFMDKEINVSSIPYAYSSNNRVVLKIDVLSQDASYEDVFALAENTGDIEYVEDDKVVNVFKNYTTGDSGFVCNYKGGSYSVELTREDSTIVTINKNKADIEYIALMADIDIDNI